ncbi:glutathione S-transferase family protein [Oceanomicrobium pacificus]|uniref:Glutathione S-transferase family protein n=1 Tax=Oceanomicrobium pacificus TaxID=2692916 RepID=A0A6B0TS65_9RHOB|nr:glutathione S-transferase family protein [Oceanomicrobium pacificus]MXU64042.1 glutathione S-transferase family protein [Oceanomicrobium pacificus]
MGALIDGKWETNPIFPTSKDGSFKRADTSFRNWITPDGAAGPTGTGGYKAESGRYHLYVSYACPWAHRTLIFRQLKGLEPHISVDVVHPLMLDDGWTFETDFPGATGDSLGNRSYLREVYLDADPEISGRVTVPILWDKKTGTIVSNESSEIIRMFNSAFDGITGNRDDYYPEELREGIDAVNARIYDTLNNGVYKCGFARSQTAYDKAAAALFDTMDWLEDRLSSRRYLMGDRLTEADWRLAVTLFRFDPVYVQHFKTNRNRLVDFPNLWAYARELYQWPGVRETVNFDHIVQHYIRSHSSINPLGIVPIGPRIDWDAPHGRERLKLAS